MYLPAAELQQYKGQWVCPYCIMELRDEDRRMEKPPETYTKKPLAATPIIYREQCERCGREAEFFYIWNGRRLCKSCLEEEQAKWGMAGGGPSAAPTRVVYNRGNEGLLGSIIKEILARIGLIRRKKSGMKGEIVAAQQVKAEIKKQDNKKNVVSFRYGKPLSEGLDEEIEGKEEKEEKKPESEGLMKEKEGKKKKKPKSEGLMKSKKKKKPKKKK